MCSSDLSLTARTTEVCHTEYVLLASGVTKGPIYSAEHLTAKQIAGAESIGRTGTWHAETGIPTADRSQSSDYTNSGYDRGHMSPAGDASTLSNEKETFSMANVVPQFHSLNAGQWERDPKRPLVFMDVAKKFATVIVHAGPEHSAWTECCGRRTRGAVHARSL